MDPVHGGPCQGIRNSVPGLQELGVSNEVVALDAPGTAFLGKDPFPIHAVGPSKGPWAYGAMLLPWLLENLPRFDAVIIHGLWLYHGYAVRKAVADLRKKNPSLKLPRVFVMPHGMLDPYFQRDSSRRLKALRNEIYWKFVESKVVRDAHGVLFTCEEELRLARETFRVYAPKRELNVGYGVAEPPPFSPVQKEKFLASCPDLAGRPYLLFLSRIHQKKGVDLLIKTYAGLLESHTAHGVGTFPSLVIAGPLDSAYASQMQVLAAELLGPSKQGGSGPGIHFTGMLQAETKWGAFYCCDAFILPSHQENFGIAVAEALACGKPVIISNKVNIWREIEDAGAGFIAEDSLGGTKDSLSRWIGLTDAERGAMGNCARNCFAGHYQVKNAAKTLAETLSAAVTGA